jgi:hypothetical protein
MSATWPERPDLQADAADGKRQRENKPRIDSSAMHHVCSVSQESWSLVTPMSRLLSWAKQTNREPPPPTSAPWPNLQSPDPISWFGPRFARYTPFLGPLLGKGPFTPSPHDGDKSAAVVQCREQIVHMPRQHAQNPCGSGKIEDNPGRMRQVRLEVARRVVTVFRHFVPLCEMLRLTRMEIAIGE